MQITFLGTSAANAFPEAFCSCLNCEGARKLGGASLRKRSSLLINDDLLIDLGPDILSASQNHGISLLNVHYCLQTHPHADHLDLSHLLSRSPELGVVDAPCLNFYASHETLQIAAQTFERDLFDSSLLSPRVQKRLNLKLHEVTPLQPFKIGAYRVIAFPANHAPTMGALLYAVEFQNSSIFYGTDTAALFEQTWQAFHRFKVRFDTVILDHTYGIDQEGNDHLNASEVIEHVARMRQEGILSKKGRAFATHMAHKGNPAHAELSAFARKNGYEIAYDGLSLYT